MPGGVAACGLRAATIAQPKSGRNIFVSDDGGRRLHTLSSCSLKPGFAAACGKRIRCPANPASQCDSWMRRHPRNHLSAPVVELIEGQVAPKTPTQAARPRWRGRRSTNKVTDLIFS